MCFELRAVRVVCVDRHAGPTQFACLRRMARQVNFVQEDERVDVERLATDVPAIDPGRHADDLAGGGPYRLHDQTRRMPRVDHVVDDEYTATGDRLVVASLEFEPFDSVFANTFGEDALDAESERRVLGADHSTDGRTADEVDFDV